VRTIAWDVCSFATLGGVCRADGDSHDNALAESFNGLDKAESIHQRPGVVSTTSSTRPSNISAGSTSGGCTERSAWSPPGRVRGRLLPSVTPGRHGWDSITRGVFMKSGRFSLLADEHVDTALKAELIRR
jgi:hypothetical protein